MHNLSMRHFWDFICVTAFLLLVIGPWEELFGGGVSLSSMSQSPSLAHPLGTDNLGRDLLVRCAAAIWGAVLPLWLSVFGATILGFGLAMFSIEIQQRARLVWISVSLQVGAAILASVPVGIAAFAWAVLSEKGGLLPVLYAVSALFFIRSFLQTMDLHRHDKHLGYWEAHRALGGDTISRQIKYGLLGSWKWRLADGLGFHFRAAVAVEASLSYLGFGVQEPAASFGNILASHFDMYLKGDFYPLILVVGMLGLTAAFPASLVSLVKMSVQVMRGSKRVNSKQRELQLERVSMAAR